MISLRASALWTKLAFAAIVVLVVYGVSYAGARSTHLLVRYESGCIGRPRLDRDLWRWSYHCAELRKYMDADAYEFAFTPLVAAEELARDREARTPARPSVCSLPVDPPGIPSQGFPVFRPAWCPGALQLPFKPGG